MKKIGLLGDTPKQGSIVSGRKWQFVVQGNVPPGVTDEEFNAYVLQSITMSFGMGALVESSVVRFGSEAPALPEGGPRKM